MIYVVDEMQIHDDLEAPLDYGKYIWSNDKNYPAMNANLFSELEDCQFLKVVKKRYDAVKYQVINLPPDTNSVFKLLCFHLINEFKPKNYLLVRRFSMLGPGCSTYQVGYRIIWYDKPKAKKAGWIPIPDHYFSFEEMLERVSPKTQSLMLFHLNIFG